MITALYISCQLILDPWLVYHAKTTIRTRHRRVSTPANAPVIYASRHPNAPDLYLHYADPVHNQYPATAEEHRRSISKLRSKLIRY